MPGGLHAGGLDSHQFFSAGLLREGDRYERFIRIDSLLSTAVTIVVFVVYARYGMRFMRDSAAGPIGTGMLLAMLGFALVWLVGLPFEVAALWWDRRHDVSDVSYWEAIFGGWLALGVEFVFLCASVLVVMGLAKLAGRHWWLPGAAFFVGLFALFTFISSYLVTGTHSLRSENPGLAARAEQLADREGARGIPIRVENVHGETSAANAFATGFGSSRKIFLWDTLLDGRFSDGEVLFVLAHEFAHQVRAHLVKAIAWYALFAVPGAFLIALATRRRGGMRQAGGGSIGAARARRADHGGDSAPGCRHSASRAGSRLDGARDDA